MNKSLHSINKSSILVFVIIATALSLGLNAQQVTSLTIRDAYGSAWENYPLIKQKDLLTKTKDYSISNAAKGYLPTFSVNGQASYQSEVTDFPFEIPGFGIPEFSKDQYRFNVELNQLVYDGGFIKNQKKTAIANEAIQQQNLEVELYELYSRVNQLFFGALLMDEQIKQNDLHQHDIQNGIDRANALVADGVAYKSSVDELSAQLLRAQQARLELAATKQAFLEMLSLFLNAEIDGTTFLEKPPSPNLSGNINRPELLAIDYQKKLFDLNIERLNAQLKPKIGVFVQGGYGRPGLNFLSNDFSWYYVGGVRLSWNIGSLYTLKNKQSLLKVSKQSLDIKKETILLNTAVSQQQQKANIEKYNSLIKKDDAIINLRVSVKEAANVQFKNGVLTAHDYINKINAEDMARKRKILHEMQLLQAQYSYQNIMGNSNNKQNF